MYMYCLKTKLLYPIIYVYYTYKHITTKKKHTTCNYILPLKDFCYLCYTNTQTNKKTVFKSSVLTSVSSSQCPSNSSDAIIT